MTQCINNFSSLVQLGILDLDDDYVVVDCVILQDCPSWFVWDAKIVDDFAIFLLVIPVLHQALHSERFELVPLT